MGFNKDFTGKTINGIQYIQKTDKQDKKGMFLYDCICFCGNSFQKTCAGPKSGSRQSCGCATKHNIKGKFFGLLEAIERTDKLRRSSYIWKVICHGCDSIVYISTGELSDPKRISCGCFKDNIIKNGKKKCGKNHRWYKPELSDEHRQKRRTKTCESTTFSNNIFKRDNYTCQKCGQYGKQLNAHHLNSYDWYIEGRSDISNGVTLCVKCHKEFHKTYSKGNNTVEQYKEWKNAN